ncbi:hypothetical protein BDN71DRAFT_1435150 [Pleurotus eryngii]|uniref:Glucose-methanol-choline oxidoreductase N-terminal domain-containing protein n=1 Tax=Pleurotus eryngii TaxID=5323 RepID=A0A9P6DBR6_PLEER|nr:hypothetical protein BDN71DRAFT_1435150 [Pleurotus eryngii]
MKYPAISTTSEQRMSMGDGRAIGVEYSEASNPSSTVIAAYERYLVIVSAGALGFPAILERSGICAAELIAQFGIKQEVDLRGENYMVHVEQWEQNGTGLLATNAINAGERLRPHLEDLEELGPRFKKVWTACFAAATDKLVTCPVSTGRVYIASADESQAGLYFEAGFSTEYVTRSIVLDTSSATKDQQILMLSDGRRRDHERSPVVCPCTVVNWRKPPMFPPDGNTSCGRRNGPSDIFAPDILYTAEDDEAINKYIRLNGEVSICPANVGADAYSTALVVGEKAAFIISQELDFGL